MDRRAFLAALGALGAVTLTGCLPQADAVVPAVTPTPTRNPRIIPSALGEPTPLPLPSPVSSIVKQPLPPPGESIVSLPVDGPFMSWTVDDGGDADVIRRYAEMARDTGTRITFFPNGKYAGWEQSADILRPLIASGQVEIGNHTYNHADLTKLSDQAIIDELVENDEYLTRIFGVSPKPFFRPPFGFHDARVDRVAASVGYSTPVMWYGSLSDSGLITTAQIMDFASQWFLPGHVIIGHANHAPVCDMFPELLELLHDRDLHTVTLRDVFVV